MLPLQALGVGLDAGVAPLREVLVLSDSGGRAAGGLVAATGGTVDHVDRGTAILAVEAVEGILTAAGGGRQGVGAGDQVAGTIAVQEAASAVALGLAGSLAGGVGVVEAGWVHSGTVMEAMLVLAYFFHTGRKLFWQTPWEIGHMRS